MTSPHDSPTAAEIVEAVKEWIERDVMSSSDGRIQFHARVAVNMLDMVMREMELGDAQAKAHASVLASLGAESDGDLSRRIRAGDWDASLRFLVAALRPVVEDKVRVANPRYLR